jgi:hypothetical protein
MKKRFMNAASFLNGLPGGRHARIAITTSIPQPSHSENESKMTFESQTDDTPVTAPFPRHKNPASSFLEDGKLRYIHWRTPREAGPGSSYPGLMDDFEHLIAAAVQTVELDGFPTTVELIHEDSSRMTLEFDLGLDSNERSHSGQRLVRGMFVRSQTDIHGQDFYEPGEEEIALIAEIDEEQRRNQKPDPELEALLAGIDPLLFLDDEDDGEG